MPRFCIVATFFHLTLPQIMGIIKKLRFNEGAKVCILNMPDRCAPLFEGLDITRRITAKKLDQVLVFAVDQQALADGVKKINTKLSNDALFWIAYPKSLGSIKSDITRDKGWEPVKNAGYAPVTQIAIDDDWSALRFRRPDVIGDKLRDIPMKDRVVEGIDFVNRVVTLPGDIKGRLVHYPELLAYFECMSFSHKKEYVQHIVEAKKPETRARRINKMIDMLTDQVKKHK